MKSKKITKKLNLNKKTVADLNHDQLKNAHGGFKITVHLTNCLACTYTCANTCPNTCVSCGPTGDIDCPCGFPHLP